MTDRKPKWLGWKVPGDSMVFWWPATADPYTHDTDNQARAMNMAIMRYKELCGELPDAEIIGRLAMVTDLENDN